MSVSVRGGYDHLLESYALWLEALNYEPKNARYAVTRVKRFTAWLQGKGIGRMDQVGKEDIALFFDELEQWVSPRTGECLSVHSLKGYQKELRRFGRYLLESGQGSLAVEITIQHITGTISREEIFSPEQVKRMYEACADDALGLRDRAMLSVYYGCGLRRNEGAGLHLGDVTLSQGMLYVRKAKNYRERYVPMSARVISDLREYLLGGRPQLQNTFSGDHFFLSYAGRPLGGQSLGLSFNRLKQRCGIESPGSLHSLRHSIATHLLQRGMALEQIARFLGHRSLESTQIYTHIVNQ